MHLPKDDDFQTARLALLYMVFDIKHSKPWTCEFCGMCRFSGPPWYCVADNYVLQATPRAKPRCSSSTT